jgi:hypothetical protein
MKKLSTSLPLPIATYKGLGAIFKVYRAKDLHKTKWNNTALKKLVLECRGSYSRYGNRPLLDAYDTKAAIYLVRATYKAKDVKSEASEWLSIRMVPGDGKLHGVGEPEIYQHKGKSMDHWIAKKIMAKDLWSNVASSSRMCGIAPFKGASHRYTGICFALIHKQFLIDYPLEKFPYRHITAIIRPDFYKRGLGYTFGKKRLYPKFIPAYKFLDVDRNEVRVKRDIYSYEFPMYWLNQKKLLQLINNLQRKNHKPAIKKLEPAMLNKFAIKNAEPITIADISITPQKMRSLIDKFVPDVPELKITEATVWYKSMDRLINAGKLKLVAAIK